MNVALNARIRHHGVTSEKAALDPRLGYELGRLHLIDGKITADQHAAGERFASDMVRYYGLSGVRPPTARAQNLFSVAGEDGESDSRAERARRATAKAMSLQAMLLATGSIQEGRDVLRIVMAVCVSDEKLGKSTRALFLLRRGLNTLGRHYSGKAA